MEEFFANSDAVFLVNSYFNAFREVDEVETIIQDVLGPNVSIDEEQGADFFWMVGRVI